MKIPDRSLYTPFKGRRLIRLDSRYNYHKEFKYVVEYRGMTESSSFIADRLYMTELFGASVEAHLYCNNLFHLNLHRAGMDFVDNCWSWSLMGHESYNFRIYLRDDLLVGTLRLSGGFV